MLARDVNQCQESLAEFLRHYQSEEFPQERFTAKISIHGTLLVHWAEKEGLAIKVPPEYVDHIVRM